MYWICLTPSSELRTMAWFILGIIEIAIVSTKLFTCVLSLETSEVRGDTLVVLWSIVGLIFCDASWLEAKSYSLRDNLVLSFMHGDMWCI